MTEADMTVPNIRFYAFVTFIVTYFTGIAVGIAFGGRFPNTLQHPTAVIMLTGTGIAFVLIHYLVFIGMAVKRDLAMLGGYVLMTFAATLILAPDVAKWIQYHAFLAIFLGFEMLMPTWLIKTRRFVRGLWDKLRESKKGG